MRAEIALYGRGPAGHSLIYYSGDDPSVARALTGKMDLPSGVPPGVEWQPYLSGMTVGEFYVLARTWPDTEAARGGFVRSLALFLPIEQASEIADLGRIAAHLELTSPEVTPVPLELASVDTKVGPAEVSLEAIGVLDQLILARDGGVAFAGQARFDAIVFQVWAALPAWFRRSFSFRLVFGANDVKDRPTALVCLPDSLASRWPGPVVIEGQVPVAEAEHPSDFFTKPDSELRSFIDRMGIRVRSFDDLRLVTMCYGYAAKRDEDFGTALAALRFALKLCPGEADCGDIKHELVRKLLTTAPRWTTVNLSSLRNLPFSGIPDRPEILAAVSSGIARHVRGTSDAADVARTIADAHSDVSVDVWRVAVFQGLEEVTRTPSAQIASRLWGFVCADESLLPALSDVCSRDSTWEEALAHSLPKRLTGALLGNAIAEAANSGQWLLHASLLLLKCQPVDALRIHLSKAPSSADSADVLVIAKTVEPADLVDLYEATSDARIISLLAAKLETGPLPFSLASLLGLRVAAEAIKKRLAFTDSSSVRTLRTFVLDQLLAGRRVDADVLCEIGRLDGGLTAEVRRSELWPVLPSSARAIFLSATVQQLLEQAVAGQLHASDRLEPELRAALLNPVSLTPFLRERTLADAQQVVRVFTAMPFLDEAIFRGWLDEASAQRAMVISQDSEAIGILINNRQWRACASLVSKLADRRRDLEPALRRCDSLVSIYDKLSIWPFSGLLKIAQDDVYAELLKVCTKLYQTGPDERDIWERAGGDRADLKHWMAGREQWRAAFDLIRKGGSGVSYGRLTSEMLGDFKGNWELQKLATYFRDL
ncbi:effector-associated domain EAD1-containing protein [Burkholderia sp. SCN-KJ]|uniref:GAP1-N1 domain-containing protein n=1 Tax=Burkholderia sp. SCN-KJ TaxID=2969248 RepID=UPI00214FC085|nr:effector-associated domain EAD1-containing protein [Burkholderia sp. SCN-KJ]MCR4470409.1 effector-associated domain EAD1-containing protein [Burkholderia sp. SCN-KJ]